MDLLGAAPDRGRHLLAQDDAILGRLIAIDHEREVHFLPALKRAFAGVPAGLALRSSSS